MDCYYCGWKNGHHDPNCPQEKNNDWEQGYSDGRAGLPNQRDDPVYLLGYGRGVVALEEAENGFDPIVEGRQW